MDIIEPQQPRQPQWNTAALYAIIALAAFVPRVASLDQFLTVDEANFWIARSEAFLNALRAGDALATAISTHPGVTTMWSGAIGILVRRPLQEAGLLPDLSVPGAIGLMRLPLALAHSLAVVVGYGLLRRMLPAGAALLAAILWACDPFVVAYSRLLHVDAPLTSFATLSLLAIIHASADSPGAPRRLRSLLLSGVCGGLALLSKSPSLLLPPLIGLIVLAGVLHGRSRWEAAGLAQVARPLLIWGAAALATMLLLWPALWAGPLKVVDQLRVGVEVEGAQPHMLGNVFLGRADDAPGALFYPVTVALRLTPWALAGLLALPLAWRMVPAASRRTLAWLALFTILFTAALTLFPKKFNRYLLPVFPALDILAAAGMWAITRGIAARWRGLPRALPQGAGAALALAAALNLAMWHPYEIAAFNQLLGGAPVGARTFAAGWGEGLELAAEWLNEQPDITGVSTISRIPAVQNPYMRRGANAETPRAGALTASAGYLVVYISQTQRGDLSPPFSQYYQRAIPRHVVTIHGVSYAWIYQIPPPVAEPRIARFGDAIWLEGLSVRGQPRPGEALSLRLVWGASATAADQMLFAHLIGPDGQRVAQVDLPLASASWQPGSYPMSELPIALPTDLPPGSYRLLIGLYNPSSGQRLPLSSAYTADAALSGADALLLTTLEIR